MKMNLKEYIYVTSRGHFVHKNNPAGQSSRGTKTKFMLEPCEPEGRKTQNYRIFANIGAMLIVPR